MNKVIIFGGDHYNALGLARVFGINGISPYGVLVVDQGHEKNIYAAKSKYWNKCWIVNSEKEGLDKIRNTFSEETEKPVIIPSSDGAELIIDDNLDILKKSFYVPSINSVQGKVSFLMNKKNQEKWAHEIGLRTAKTWEIDLQEDNCVKKIELFPCILKPVISSEGEKSDIVKCLNEHDAVQAIKNLRKKGYVRILAQEFLDKEYEVELFGCIPLNHSCTPYLLSKHLREWPPMGGSVSCHEFIVDNKYKKEAEKILGKIKDFGYTGNIDIELFMIRGELYLNEVNFRNSGDVYACFYNKVFYPVIWYFDIIGQNISKFNTEYDSSKYAMNETTDFRHVLYGNMKFRDWIKYYKKTADFAIKFKGDMKPMLIRYKHYIINAIINGKKQKILGKAK